MGRIETQRLVLSLYTERDKEHLIGLLTDPSVMKYVDKGVLTRAQAEALWIKLLTRFYPNGVDTIWAITAKSDGRYLGNASIRPRPERQKDWEIGYYLRPEEWGKGYGSEVARCLVNFGRESLGLPEIYATVETENLASRRVLEKAGLKFYRKEYDEQGVFFVYRTPENSEI